MEKSSGPTLREVQSNISSNNTKGTRKVKKKTAAEYQREYRARKKARREQNDLELNGFKKISKRKTAAEKQRDYRARLKAKRKQNSMNSEKIESENNAISVPSGQNVIDETFKEYVQSSFSNNGQNQTTERLFSWSCICRICAKSNDRIIPIFDAEGAEQELSDKIHKYLPIWVDKTDILPIQLCCHCVATIHAWHKLFTGCLDAQKQLLQMLSDHNSIDSQKTKYDENLKLMNNSESLTIVKHELSLISEQEEGTEYCDVNEKAMERSDSVTKKQRLEKCSDRNSKELPETEYSVIVKKELTDDLESITIVKQELSEQEGETEYCDLNNEAIKRSDNVNEKQFLQMCSDQYPKESTEIKYSEILKKKLEDDSESIIIVKQEPNFISEQEGETEYYEFNEGAMKRFDNATEKQLLQMCSDQNSIESTEIKYSDILKKGLVNDLKLIMIEKQESSSISQQEGEFEHCDRNEEPTKRLQNVSKDFSENLDAKITEVERSLKEKKFLPP